MINDSEKQENKGSLFVDYYNTKNETPFLWDFGIRITAFSLTKIKIIFFVLNFPPLSHKNIKLYHFCKSSKL